MMYLVNVEFRMFGDLGEYVAGVEVREFEANGISDLNRKVAEYVRGASNADTYAFDVINREGYFEQDCRYCHGAGEVTEGIDDMYGMVSTWQEDCRCCHGTGKLWVTHKTCKCGTRFAGEYHDKRCNDCEMEYLLDQIEEDKSNGITR